MGTALMAADEERVFEAIGGLKSQVSNLGERFDRLIADSMAEHRKVHDIVVATSESIRILTREVADMKPVADDYRLRAKAIQDSIDLTDAYKEERAEKRGAEKFKTWIYGIVASMGGLIAIGVSKLIDRLLSPPHLPVIAGIVAAITLIATAVAFGQEHHAQGHAYYQNWINQRDKGCCNNQDCGSLADENERHTPAGIEVRIEGRWCPVEPWHYLKRGNAPDWSTAHVCVRKLYYAEPFVSPCERLLCYQPKPGI